MSSTASFDQGRRLGRRQFIFKNLGRAAITMRLQDGFCQCFLLPQLCFREVRGGRARRSPPQNASGSAARSFCPTELLPELEKPVNIIMYGKRWMFSVAAHDDQRTDGLSSALSETDLPSLTMPDDVATVQGLAPEMRISLVHCNN